MKINVEHVPSDYCAVYLQLISDSCINYVVRTCAGYKSYA